MENKVEQLEREVREIKERNRRVEADKAWETSGFRVLFIVIITYVTASLVLYVIGVKDFFLGALVSTVGYFLSSRSLSVVKKWWIKKYLKNDNG